MGEHPRLLLEGRRSELPRWQSSRPWPKAGLTGTYLLAAYPLLCPKPMDQALSLWAGCSRSGVGRWSACIPPRGRALPRSAGGK